MRLLLVVTVISILAITVPAKKVRKFDGDFEFAEEDETKTTKSGEKKRWIHDPLSDLCRPLNCKKKEMCLLENAFTAVCVSKKELQKNGDVVIPKSMVVNDNRHRTPDKKELDNSSEGDETDDVFYDIEDDPDEDQNEEGKEAVACKPCPVIKPTFLCGSDNRTYSSLCRLDYHNCIHHAGIHVSCKGFCPCKESDIHLRKKQRQSERLNSFLNKYKNTIEKDSANRQDRYTYIPEDFKYENKHYKYIKYSKYNKENGGAMMDANKRQRLFNEALDTKKHGNYLDSGHYASNPHEAVSNDCPPTALQTMGNRLLDWFSVVMADTKRRRQHSKTKAHLPVVCKAEVKWMFQHLDLNADSRLTLQELYDLEHDQNEVCIKPFLEQCDTDHDMIISPYEWCRCFDKSDRPCAAVKRRITPELLGVYVPSCDTQGYYKSTQCNSATGMCWCVDKHGVEFANTRTHDRPNCVMNAAPDKILKPLKSPSSSTDDEDDNDDIEQELEGSADQALDF